MAFTDNCDVFGAVHEEGVNRVVRHIMQQRPSLFNYATAFFAEHPELFCVPIRPAKEVTAAGNRLFEEQDPLLVMGTPFPIGLNFCFQITDFQIDFHPGSVFDLPSELAPLEEQRMALSMRACFGLGCPPRGQMRELLPIVERYNIPRKRDQHPLPTFDRPYTFPVFDLMCFCLELFAEAHFEWGTVGGDPQQWLKVRLDGVEIVDLQPDEMESMIECYIRAVLELGILPQLMVPMEKMILNITELLQTYDFTIGETVTLEPTPAPAKVPHNPAVEEDQIKAFVSLVVV